MKSQPHDTFHLKWLAASVLLVVCIQTAFANNKAYVFVGIDSNPKETAANVKAAASAKANYERQGYQVCVDNTPTQAEIIAACNDPNARGLWMVGHGGRTPAGAYVPYWAYNTSAGAADRGVTPAALGGGTFNQFTSVTFHGCGQLLPAWSNKFPNALYTSWTGAVKANAIRWDEWWRGQNRIPQKGGNAPEGAGIMNPLVVDARIEAGIPFTYFEDIGLELDVPRADYGAMLWCMPEALAIEFGALKFNVIVTDGFDTLLSDGLFVVDGEVVEQVEDGYADPDFTYILTPEAALAAIENIDTLPESFDLGMLMIADNTTGLEDFILFEGASNVLFGLFSEACEGCIGDFDNDGVVNTTDLLTLLSEWGSCEDGCISDIDGNGEVNTADLLILLAAWGDC